MSLSAGWPRKIFPPAKHDKNNTCLGASLAARAQWSTFSRIDMYRSLDRLSSDEPRTDLDPFGAHQVEQTKWLVDRISEEVLCRLQLMACPTLPYFNLKKNMTNHHK